MWPFRLVSRSPSQRTLPLSLSMSRRR
jgi:hypothetical protein